MSKSYKVAKKTINMGEKKGQTLFSVRPYSYGTLTTEEVANQIAVESTATPADVKAVLDRYAYYVKENLKKGYDIELLGFGKLFIRFITGKAVEDVGTGRARRVAQGQAQETAPHHAIAEVGSDVGEARTQRRCRGREAEGPQRRRDRRVRRLEPVAEPRRAQLGLDIGRVAPASVGAPR